MAIVGIDLGTTNSLIGRIEKGRPRLFSGDDGKHLVPSAVEFPAGEAPVVGASAKARLAEPGANVLYSVKRFIGRGLADVAAWNETLPFDLSPSDHQMVRFRVGEKTVTPIEVSALVLKKLKMLAEAQTGETIDKAVITVPAYFNDAQRQATKFAGELAGLEVARIVNEPTAACLAYGLDKKTMGTIAVFDLGGGTFDISILRVQDGVFEVLATNGDTALGGDDFDHEIVKAILPEIRSSLGAECTENSSAKAQLVQQAERVKRELSERDSAIFRFEVAGKTFQRSIRREELEAWILPLLSRAEEPCQRCLEDAGVKPEQITDVILVGGSTRVPSVRACVQRLFRREPICTLNPDEVVAMGAAVQANILAGQMGEMLLLDVLPLSLGIETMGGVIGRILHRNTTIPVSASQTYTTYVDGQVSVDIHVVQGERELSKDNRSLARFQLKGLPPLPAGVPKIEVEFIVDANGILNVRAMELRTGKTASILVNPSYGLDDTEVERMLMESFEHAEADFAARFLSEAKTEADGLLRAARKSVAKGKDLVDSAELDRIEAALKDLEASLSATEHKLVKQRIEAVNDATRGLAEKLMNRAVSEALKDKVIPTEGK